MPIQVKQKPKLTTYVTACDKKNKITRSLTLPNTTPDDVIRALNAAANQDAERATQAHGRNATGSN